MLDAPPPPMTMVERSRLRTAAMRARRLYPGPVGVVLAEELFTWEQFGYRFGGRSAITRLVDELLTATAVPAVAP